MPPGELAVVSLGFVTPAKCIEQTIRALASIRPEVPPFKCHSASLEPVTTTYDDSMVNIMLIQARRQKLSKQGEMHAKLRETEKRQRRT